MALSTPPDMPITILRNIPRITAPAAFSRNSCFLFICLLAGMEQLLKERQGCTAQLTSYRIAGLFFFIAIYWSSFCEVAVLGVRKVFIYAQKMYCRLCLFQAQILIPLRDEGGNVSTEILGTVEKYTGVQVSGR